MLSFSMYFMINSLINSKTKQIRLMNLINGTSKDPAISKLMSQMQLISVSIFASCICIQYYLNNLSKQT